MEMHHTYSRDLLRRLRKQRDEGLYCDFGLHVEDQVFKVHKCILAANSPLIQTMLGSDSDGAAKFIVLAHVSAGAVQALLDFMYTGYLDFNSLNVPAEEIFNAAKTLKVFEVEKIYKLHTENVDIFKGIAQQGNLLKVTRKDRVKPLHGQGNANSDACIVNTCDQIRSTNTNIEISFSKILHNLASNHENIKKQQKHSTGKDLHPDHGPVSDSSDSIDTVSVNDRLQRDHENRADSEVYVDQIEHMGSNVDYVCESEDKTYEKQPEEIQNNNINVTVRLDKPESQPIIWKTSEKKGALTLYKPKERKRALRSDRPQERNAVDRPVNYNSAFQRVDRDVLVIKSCENDNPHVEHSYATDLCVGVLPVSGTPSGSVSDQSAEIKSDHERADVRGDFLCVICDSSFQTRKSLVNHLKSKKSHKRFPRAGKCPHCAKRFLHKQALINHMKSAHLVTSERTCKKYVNGLVAKMALRDGKMAAKHTDRMKMRSFCMKPFKSKETLTQHMKKKHQQLKFKCLKCRRAFPSLQSLIRHRGYAHQVQISCKVCGEQFSSVLRARKHTAENHKEERVSEFSCKFCYRKFPLASLLHSHACRDRDNLKCGKCLKNCHCYGHYERHMKSDKKRQYVCDICNQIFVKQCTLKQHKYSHKQESFYICKICKKIVDSESHLKTHQVESTDSDGKISYQWECPKCKKLLKNLGYYFFHMKNHENECDVCGRCYSHPDDLKKHKTVHTNPAIVCDKCGQHFQSFLSYKHHESQNMCKETSACPFCGEVYKRWGLLIRHVRKHKVKTVHNLLGEGEYYKCPKCDKVIKSFSYLQAHYRTHTSGKPHSCHLCNKGFVKVNMLNRHLAVVHGEPVAKVKICTVCETRCPGPSSLKRHMLINHECEGCGETFEKKEDKLVHEATVHEDMQGQFVCETCGKPFQFLHAFQRHVNNHDNWKKQVKESKTICDVCGASYLSEKGLRQHMKKHTADGGKCECKICGGKYSNKSGLRRHMRKHSGKQICITCDICGATYRSKWGLQNHMKKHSADGGKRECTLCGAIYGSESGFRNHMKNHLEGKKIQLRCNECGARYSSKEGLHEHMRKHSADGVKVECRICGTIYQSLSGLRRHMKKHSAEELQVVCKTCGAIYRSVSGLRRHMSKHLGEGYRGQCSVCGTLYHSKSGLEKHMAKKHSVEVPIQGECTSDICGAVLTTQDALKKHLDEHFENIEVFEENLVSEWSDMAL